MVATKVVATLTTVAVVSCIFLLGLMLRTDSSYCYGINADQDVPRPLSMHAIEKQENICPLPGTGGFTLRKIRSTVLASYPGSGNTWTRYLLTTASGILTASRYNIDSTVNIIPNTRVYRVIAVKTHETPNRTRRLFPYDRCLLVIRNPYETFLANFNRLGKKPTESYTVHHTIRSGKDFETEWPKFVSTRMGGWLDFNRAWLSDCKPPKLHVLVYSRMFENLGHELDLVFRFLNESTITPRIHCALRYSEGLKHRASHDWQKKLAVFTEKQKKALNHAIDEIQTILEHTTGQSFADFQAWKR